MAEVERMVKVMIVAMEGEIYEEWRDLRWMVKMVIAVS